MKRFWIINLFLFQLSWLCAAFLTDYVSQIMLVLLILHFALSPSRMKDFKLMLLVPIGLVADKTQLMLGIFSTGDSFFPVWLMLLWVMFIVSLNHSLSWLDNRSVLTLIAIGALGGTSSYWGGIKAGVIEPLASTNDVVLSLMLVWGCLLPVFIILKRYLIHKVHV